MPPTDNVELAQEHLEHAAHADHAGHAAPPAATRRAAILVAVFAAVAVVLEMSANDAQTEYLARTITASDLWAEYQAKSVRRAVRLQAADALGVIAPGPAAAAAIARATSEAARLADDPAGGGMKQIAVHARADEHVRDEALHHHAQLERSVRVLQIAIVLIGLYLATRLDFLVLLGAVLGAGAILWGALAALLLV